MLVPDTQHISLPVAAPYEYEARLRELPPLTGDPKADFVAQRKFIADVHRAGASGQTVVRLQSAAMDRIVVVLWERAAHEAAGGRPASPVSLLALGGYGRRDLAPFSDVDLLVLHAGREPDAFEKTASERFLYALWDLRLEVGYGVRDIRACDQLASEDHTARTALLDLRHLAGDRTLFRELEREELNGLSQAKVDKFLADKLEEMRSRRDRFGDSLYLLEPNVKESEGRLRDLQSALWLARVRFKVAGLTELLARALLPERDIREMRRARDFLWRVRNEMHYLAGRKWDQLTFDVQPQVTAALGYADGEQGSAVEEFMRHYYLAAKTVLVACDAIVDRCLEPQNATGWRMVPPPAATIGAERPVPILQGQPTRGADRLLPGGELKVFRNRLSVVDKDVLRRSPAALVRLFATADREQLDLYPYARDLAAQAAEELGPEAATDPELNQELLSCFTRPGTRGRFLTLMHELGVLEKVIPEFARITARRQIDVYHVYSVDVHTLFAVRRLLALKHLRMAAIEQRRDLSDPELIHAFAEEAGTLDRLDKLFLLTYADIATVGPRTWTDWKARLLRELFHKAQDVLRGGERRPTPGTAESEGRELALEALQHRAWGVRVDDHDRFVAAMPARYFLTVAPGLAPRHLRLLALGRERALATSTRHRKDLGHTDVAVTARDRPGLLATIA